MTTEKVRFTEVKETMLITLYSRAFQSRSAEPLLPDRWAEEAVEHIDYDFGKLKIKPYESLSIAIRAKQFDMWTAAYLADHPDATVVHLGCGMDSRVFRVNPPASVRWFDVDYPEVIDLRRRLYPERPGYSLVGTSLADLAWLDSIPGDHPAMIVAEGVMMYLTEDIVRPLLNGLTNHFPGGQIAFDALDRLGLRTAKVAPSTASSTGATFGWAIDDPQDIKHFAPKLDLVTELRIVDMPGCERLPWTLRVVMRVMDLVPTLRRMNRPLLYRF